MKSYQVILSDHNNMKLENTQNEKIHKYMGLNKMLNNTQVIKKQQKRGEKEQRANIKYRKSVARW